jgi:hypothetical protein
MTVSIAVVCDAPADRITITTLAERVICEAAPWIEPEMVGDFVEWRGFRRVDTHLEWTGLKQHSDDLGLVVRFSGVKPLHPYAQNALRAIRVLARSPDRVDAIVMVADSDTDRDRLKGLEQAREYAREALPIVVGLAHTKRECWHLAGFEPKSDEEFRRVEAERQYLGFDPRTRSHELTAKHDESNDKRSSKRVLRILTAESPERERDCLIDLTLLRKNGEENGLQPFLDELESILVPLFTR